MLPSLQTFAAERLGVGIAKSAERMAHFGIGGHWLANRVIARDFWGANALYVHACTATRALIEAKRRGLFTVLEAISHPFNKRIEASLCRQFGAEVDQAETLIEQNIAYFKEETRWADLVLAASPYVRDGLVDLGVPYDRIKIVRYGLAANFFQGQEPRVQVGKVLFVGAVNHLKGIPVLAEFARRAPPDISVEIVGPLSHHASRPEFKGPTYLGQVPRSEVRSHFLTADVFVFPSYSDGFGLTILEAMAAGLPVISTPNCADLVRDGENGFVVPAGDVDALYNRILTIIRDRPLRHRMSEASRTTAALRTQGHYAADLAAALNVEPTGPS